MEETIPPPSHEVKHYGSLERFPAYASTVEKRVLYALLVNEPSGFCAPSLVTVVGRPVAAIREALTALNRLGFLDAEPVPRELMISADEHYYRIRLSRLREIVEYLHE